MIWTNKIYAFKVIRIAMKAQTKGSSDVVQHGC